MTYVAQSFVWKPWRSVTELESHCDPSWSCLSDDCLSRELLWRRTDLRKKKKEKKKGTALPVGYWMYNRAGYVFIFTYLLWREPCRPLTPDPWPLLCESSEAFSRLWFNMRGWVEMVWAWICFCLIVMIIVGMFFLFINWFKDSICSFKKNASGWEKKQTNKLWTKCKSIHSVFIKLEKKIAFCVGHNSEIDFMPSFHICALKPFK